MFHGCIRYVSLELLCCFSNCWVVDRRVGDCLVRILVVCRQIVSPCFGYYMFIALLTGAISYSLVYFQSKITLMEVVKKDISIIEVTKEYDFGLDRMVEKKICGQLSLVYWGSQANSKVLELSLDCCCLHFNINTAACMKNNKSCIRPIAYWMTLIIINSVLQSHI